MGRVLTALVVVMAAFGVSAASAQERNEGSQRWEVTGFPGGGFLLQEGSGDNPAGAEADFTNYSLGGSLTYNFNQYFGVEGEFGGSIGFEQSVGFGGGNSIGDITPPDMFSYNANAIVYPFRNDRRFVPYATGGIGGLNVRRRESAGFNGDETFLTGNFGGGAKYYFNNWWGVRGDYRFFAIDSKEDTPAFFGRETRYGHRVYGGLVFGFGQ